MAIFMEGVGNDISSTLHWDSTRNMHNEMIVTREGCTWLHVAAMILE